MPAPARQTDRAVRLVVLVAALGYFVDIFDLILFSTVRQQSLLGLGVPKEWVLPLGVDLLNLQMAGMLVGGILWGILGDKRGRLSVLFGSIILYSVANIANGMVDTLTGYAACRFIAGIGLAGELGAGVTLVAEMLPKEKRGWGTTIVAAVGLCGGVAATIIGGAIPQIYAGMDWRHAYYVGGVLGLLLLGLRIGVVESGMYAGMGKAVSRGNFFALFWPPARLKRYLAVIVVGVPIWCVFGVLMSLSPEIGAALGLSPAPHAPTALLCSYAGIAAGDIGSGAISQLWRSRKKTLALFLGLTAVAAIAYFAVGGTSLTAFYATAAALGLASGYWAVFVTTAAEQFGTNLRATATTTTPNFVRGSVPLVTMLFTALAGSLGVVGAAIAVTAVCLAAAGVALAAIPETFGKDLDYVED
jgi:hypothetical protein